MTIKQDKLSSELRKIEQEVDNYYQSNLLLRLPFGVAAWYLLAYFDDLALIELSKTKSPFDFAILSDELVVQLRYPLYWLWSNCKPGGAPPLSYDNDCYNASHELSYLADNYESWVTVFTYASHGWLELEIDQETISPKGRFNHSYEAYDFFNKTNSLRPENASSMNGEKVFQQIRNTLQIHGENFSYKIGKRSIDQAIEYLSNHFERVFTLPKHWTFSRYSLHEFREMVKVIVALAFIHFTARIISTQKGIRGLGYPNSILLYRKEKLEWQIVRNANVKPNVATAFIDDLTYGNRGIRTPDPALQPLIKLNDETYALAPFLLLSNSMERNLTILLNRIPAERSVYSKLVDEKENSMREKLKSNIANHDVRFFNGGLPDNSLPDIDLAIISDSEKALFIIEMKWLIEPSDQREVIEKSQEISHGISQLLKLAESQNTQSNVINKTLNIDDTYQIFYLVVSDNFIGHERVQDSRIPVVNINHFIEKYNDFGKVRDFAFWLLERKYLPTEGKHFEVEKTTSKIGKWQVQWWGVKPLLDGIYL